MHAFVLGDVFARQQEVGEICAGGLGGGGMVVRDVSVGRKRQSYCNKEQSMF
jgi:hypothetical protein